LIDMGIEGQLEIHLQRAALESTRVDISSSRPLQASRVLHGKTIEQALQLLPLLFSVCGIAQACAAVRACEQALGLQAEADLEQRRDSLMQMETLREHLWRIALDWPVFIGEQAMHEPVAALLVLQKRHRQALSAEFDLFLPTTTTPCPAPEPLADLIGDIDTLLAQTVFDMVPSDWLGLRGPRALQDWAQSGATVAARLIRHVIDQGWSDAGRCAITALPALDGDALRRATLQDGFIAQPQWQGDCHETSPLTRNNSPLLQALRADYGNGLLVRLVARLTELARRGQDLDTETDTGTGNNLYEQPLSNPGTGIGQAAAARGQLFHRVAIDHQTVIDYRILAPTEWNFHPQGVVAASLATLSGDPAPVEQQARLLINAIDPCVAYRLSID